MVSYADDVPADVKQELDNYAEFGHEVGAFVAAVLRNDFWAAVSEAGPEARAAIWEIALYVHWNLPGKCHGSNDRVQNWRRHFRGLAGEAEQASQMARNAREQARI